MNGIGKIGSAVLCAALAFGVVGCGQSSTQQGSGTQEQQTQEQKTASIGDTIEVQTKYGDLAVTVEGFETNSAYTEEYQDRTWFGSGNTFCALLLTVENKSYQSGSSNAVKIGDYISATIDGASIAPLDTGNPYDSYTNALNGWLNEFPTGSKVKCVLTYALRDVPTQVVAKVGDTEVTMDVTAR